MEYDYHGKLQSLSPQRQAEVLDFVEFLAKRQQEELPWTESAFGVLSLAMREVADEPALYSPPIAARNGDEGERGRA